MSTTYEATGTVKLIEDTQTFGSGFTKREFVITTAGEYPDDIKFEVVKDKCEALNSVAVGDEVEVSFNIRGNEWSGKYYVNLQCWKFSVKSKAQAPQPGTMQNSVDDGNDIPFSPIL